MKLFSGKPRIQFYIREFVASLERYIDALEHSGPDDRQNVITWIGEWDDTQKCLLELVSALEALRHFA